MSVSLYHATDGSSPYVSAWRYFQSKAADPVRAVRLARPNRHTVKFVRQRGGKPDPAPAGAATSKQTAAILRRWNAGERLASITRNEHLPRDIVWRVITAAGRQDSKGEGD